MNRKKMRPNNSILILFLVASLLGVYSANAQSFNCQPILQEIYKTYDSIKYLSFDVKYIYSSDTLYGDSPHDVMEGSYTLAGKKARFSLGDIEFMQNDSFLISVYNDNKFILVSDPRTKNSGSELPMREIMDSLASTSNHYTMSTTKFGDTATITFLKADSTAQFLQFQMTYDSAKNLFLGVKYVFEEMAITDSSGEASMPANRKRTLSVEFSNYRFDHVADRFYDENEYIYFEDRVCKPVDKYDSYKVYYMRRADRPVVVSTGG